MSDMRAGETDSIRSGLSILCVDDHQDTLVAMSRLLRIEGHDVAAARSYAEAVEVARGQRGQLDLLIADVGLPDGDGLTLLSRIRQHHQRVEGIVLSGFGMADDLSKSESAGYRFHLTKPIDLDQLLQAIEQVKR